MYAGREIFNITIHTSYSISIHNTYIFYNQYQRIVVHNLNPGTIL